MIIFPDLGNDIFKVGMGHLHLFKFEELVPKERVIFENG